jgi:hypothetical protein
MKIAASSFPAQYAQLAVKITFSVQKMYYNSLFALFGIGIPHIEV